MSVFSQQSAQYSLYALNPYSFNSAYAGMENSLIVTADVRKQWIGIDGSPSNQSLNFHLPLYFLSGGIGFQIENDQLGASRNSRFLASYNYFFEINEQSKLSIGINGGIVQHSYDGSVLRSSDGNYEPGAINHNDEILSSISQSAISPNFGAGLMFQYDQVFVGVSTDNVLESQVDFSGDFQTTFQRNRHYYGFIKYDLEINDFIGLSPSLLYKSDFTESQVEINLLTELDQKFYLGAGYRGVSKNATDAVIIMGGIKLNDHFTIVYSYDLGLSELKNVQNGSHEFLVKYDLNKKIGGGYLPNIIYNPRFL